jgi:hypothetical protein
MIYISASVRRRRVRSPWRVLHLNKTPSGSKTSGRSTRFGASRAEPHTTQPTESRRTPSSNCGEARTADCGEARTPDCGPNRNRPFRSANRHWDNLRRSRAATGAQCRRPARAAASQPNGDCRVSKRRGSRPRPANTSCERFQHSNRTLKTSHHRSLNSAPVQSSHNGRFTLDAGATRRASPGIKLKGESAITAKVLTRNSPMINIIIRARPVAPERSTGIKAP